MALNGGGKDNTCQEFHCKSVLRSVGASSLYDSGPFDPGEVNLCHWVNQPWINAPQCSRPPSHRSVMWQGTLLWAMPLLAMWMASRRLAFPPFWLFCPCKHNSPNTCGTKWNLNIKYHFLLDFIHFMAICWWQKRVLGPSTSSPTLNLCSSRVKCVK
jgi:hypothetical protein